MMEILVTPLDAFILLDLDECWRAIGLR